MARGETIQPPALVPPRPFLDSLLVRVVLLWAFIRLVTLGGAAMTGVPSSVALDTGRGLPLGPFALALLVIPVVLAMIHVDLFRRSEVLFLANLGVSLRRLSLLVAGVCVALEVALRIAVG